MLYLFLMAFLVRNPMFPCHFVSVKFLQTETNVFVEKTYITIVIPQNLKARLKDKLFKGDLVGKRPHLHRIVLMWRLMFITSTKLSPCQTSTTFYTTSYNFDVV